jgi:hypothetical protein
LASAVSASGIKELLTHGKIDAAHMLSPMPLACAAGIDGKPSPLRLCLIQNVNGQALTLATRHLGSENRPALRGGLTFGVPYLYSMQYYLLCHYLAEQGIERIPLPLNAIAPTSSGATMPKVSWYRTAMPYYHNTDAELNPGDELLPSAERGHRSRWAEDEYGTVPTYDPHSVYMYRETGNPEHFQEYGKNRYEVEPVGDVRRDPEWLDLMEDDEEIDPEDFGVSPEDAPGFHSYVAPRAKVVRKL